MGRQTRRHWDGLAREDGFRKNIVRADCADPAAIRRRRSRSDPARPRTRALGCPHDRCGATASAPQNGAPLSTSPAA